MYFPRTDMLLHQRLAFDRSWQEETFAWLMDPRMGKTKLFIDNAAALYEAGKINTAFVLAPNGVHRNWLLELQKHMPERIPHAAAFYRSGTVNKEITRVLERKDCLRFVTVNVEALSHKSGLDFCLRLLKGSTAIGAVDESHRFKTPSSKRTRNGWKLRAHLPYRRILSGTAVSIGYQDLYGQYAFLDPAIIGCRTYTEFKTMFCVMVGEYNTIVGYKNIPYLLKKLGPWTFSATREEYMAHLPPQDWVEYETSMSPEQTVVYRQLRDLLLTEWQGHIIDAPLPITKVLRLQQVTAGHLPGPDDGTWVPLPCPRIDDAVELAQTKLPAGSKGIVWAIWRADIVQLSAAFRKAGLTCVTYYGDDGNEQAAANLHQWQHDTETKWLIGTPRKGGVGFPMHQADTVINYSYSFSYEDWKQSQDRNHGPMQTRPCVYYNLVAPGTINRRVLQVLAKRRDVAAVLRDPATFRQWLTTPDD